MEGEIENHNRVILDCLEITELNCQFKSKRSVLYNNIIIYRLAFCISELYPLCRPLGTTCSVLLVIDRDIIAREIVEEP